MTTKCLCAEPRLTIDLQPDGTAIVIVGCACGIRDLSPLRVTTPQRFELSRNKHRIRIEVHPTRRTSNH